MRADIHYRKAVSVMLVIAGLILVIAGCSINLTIETDYASQRDGDGIIKEEVFAESTAESKAKVDATVEAPIR
ncbi:MAG: hypothetical protein ACRCVX_02355 [Shewanella sp.]